MHSTLFSVALNLPAGHEPQVRSSVALPLVDTCVPGAHVVQFKHELEPESFWYSSAPQGLHVPAFSVSEYVPAGQVAHARSDVDDGELVSLLPFWHCVRAKHNKLPELSWYLFCEHAVHSC